MFPNPHSLLRSTKVSQLQILSTRANQTFWIIFPHTPVKCRFNQIFIFPNCQFFFKTCLSFSKTTHGVVYVHVCSIDEHSFQKAFFFKIKTSTVLPEVVKLADHPGNGLPDHVDPLELGRAISPNQVKDVEVSVKEHRGGGIPFQGGNQSSLFTCCQNLCLVKVG